MSTLIQQMWDMTIIQAGAIMLSDHAHARTDFDPRYAGGTAFSNGTYSSLDDATVPMWDLGFTQADAAYDVFSTIKGLFFRLEDHLRRMESSCERFRLKSPYSRDETVAILTKLLRLAGTKDAYVWWAVTRGHMPDGNSRVNPKAYENCFYAFVVPYLHIADDERRTRGLNLSVSKKYIRIPAASVDPVAKNFHWMDLKLALFEAYDQGREWSVLCDADGNLAESLGANVFVIKGGVVSTPKSGCLEGITRETSLELAQ